MVPVGSRWFRAGEVVQDAGGGQSLRGLQENGGPRGWPKLEILVVLHGLLQQVLRIFGKKALRPANCEDYLVLSCCEVRIKRRLRWLRCVGRFFFGTRVKKV